MAFRKTAGWYVISLRPQGGHAALRRAAARRGARLLALSPWRIVARADAATRTALARALAAERVLFTSPAAVQAAAALQDLHARPGQIWLAVGSGTARALQRHGVAEVLAPQRMDSEGLLALPALQAIDGGSLGFVSAPAGRNLLAPTLRERGADLRRADVYDRVDLALPAQALRRLAALDAPACVLISSGGALERILAQVDGPARTALLRSVAVVASERLARQAAAAGFDRIQQAAGPRDAQLLAAAEVALATSPIR